MQSQEFFSKDLYTTEVWEILLSTNQFRELFKGNVKCEHNP